jgi:putative ABC transport system substrate-binding protein
VISRRTLIAAFAVTTLHRPRIARAQQAAPGALVAWAQPAPAVYRVGYLASAPVTAPEPLMGAFLGRLEQLGYVEGRNLLLERRSAEGRNERYRMLAAELVNLKVDLILAPGTAAALAAKEATSTIPIVMVLAGDPVGTRLIASYARPGGNVTGTTSAGGEITAKQLELLKEIVPRVSRIAVLANPTTALHATLLKDLEIAARTLRVSLHPFDVKTPQELDRALTAIARERLGALIPLDDPLMFQERRRIAEFALRQRLPAASFQRFFTEAGSLFSYGPSFTDLFRRAATYVDRILKGAKPADLPVEQPTTFELVINQKTAKALGLKIAPALLQRADHIIE